jgi:hypothetical protein
VFQASMVGFFLVVTIYLQTGLGFSAIDSGLTLVPFSVGAFVGTGMATVDPAHAGAAAGAYGTFQQIGAAIGVAAVGVVFFGVVGSTFTAQRMSDAIDAASWVAVIGFAACALVTVFLPSRSVVRQHAHQEKALASA